MKVAAAVIISAACGLAFALDGFRGLAGMVAGLVSTALSVWAWWRLAALLGAMAKEAGFVEPAEREGNAATEPGEPEALPKSRISGFGSAAVVMLFLAKVPLFVALGFLATRLGGRALPCLLAGMGLVYCGLIAWARSSEVPSV